MTMSGSPVMTGYAIDGQSVPWASLPHGVAATPTVGPMPGFPSVGPVGGVTGFGVDPLAIIFSQLALQGILIPQHVFDPETLALNAFLQGATTCLIPKLSNYVGGNVAQFPQLSQGVPLITRAAEFYGQRDFARSLAQVYQAYRLVAMLRSQQPSLPDPAI
jgi:hypothetical protein